MTSTNHHNTSDGTSPRALTAQQFYSGFDKAHDTYNAISVASDGKVYYVLSSESVKVGGQMYAYNPQTNHIQHLGDLTEICGEKGQRAISQGKSHVSFHENQGKLYFATHIGYYEQIDGMERLPVTKPDGYNLYPGGHLLAYDLASETFDDLAIAPHGEGILTLTMDKDRNLLYGITWPKGYFIQYDIQQKKLETYGLIHQMGEAGFPGDDYRVLCRSMFVDPKDGQVYFTTSDGNIFSFSPSVKSICKLEGVHLRLDYFGGYDPTRPGSMGYHWRQIFWHPTEEVAYGVHGNSGYLFRFDPRKPSVELLERITSEPSRRSGMSDQFSYGYLGFQLSPDQETIYYLTGGPVYQNGQRLEGEKSIAKGGARGIENLHLVTYHLPTRQYRDHGSIFYPDGTPPTYVNSIAISEARDVYTLARFEHEGQTIQDLIRISISKTSEV
uniref:Uncharacterized protein n=1 Tax=Roseihalotalea indica TaxID=2867963 RepID=A0AA49GTG9_9BACT|nr:hypothetical protein K4G66_01020 [Tunicatimonas sp. TK19036]